MIVSLEAIFLTLFVLTSQNRQRTLDRIRSDIEFESSINTETKIAYLHEKIDKLTEGPVRAAGEHAKTSGKERLSQRLPKANPQPRASERERHNQPRASARRLSSTSWT